MRYLHTFNSESEAYDYLEFNYEEPFIGRISIGNVISIEAAPIIEMEMDQETGQITSITLGESGFRTYDNPPLGDSTHIEFILMYIDPMSEGMIQEQTINQKYDNNGLKISIVEYLQYNKVLNVEVSMWDGAMEE